LFFERHRAAFSSGVAASYWRLQTLHPCIYGKCMGMLSGAIGLLDFHILGFYGLFFFVWTSLRDFEAKGVERNAK